MASLFSLFAFATFLDSTKRIFPHSGRISLVSTVGFAILQEEASSPRSSGRAGELIRRQLGNSFGDFFDFHVVQYSTAEVWLSDGKGFGARPPTVLGQVSSVPNQVIAAHDLGADRERGL